jgi:hypothetical protein
MIDKLRGVVEIDEVWIGPKEKGRPGVPGCLGFPEEGCVGNQWDCQNAIRPLTAENVSSAVLFPKLL